MDYRLGNSYPEKSNDLPQTCDSLIIKMVPILLLLVSGFSVTGLGSFSIMRWGLLPYPWAGLLDLSWPTECRGSDLVSVLSLPLREPCHCLQNKSRLACWQMNDFVAQSSISSSPN